MELSSFVITGRIMVLDLSIHYYYDIFFKIIYLHTRKYHVFYLSSLYKGHATHLVWNQLTSLFSTTIFLRGIMHIVRTQLKGRSPAYIYLLNCAPLLFFCVQGGGPRKNVFAFVQCTRIVKFVLFCIEKTSNCESKKSGSL